MALPQTGQLTAETVSISTSPDSLSFRWEDAGGRLAGLPGGAVNIAHEILDRHVAEGRKERVALRWLGRSNDDRRDYTYAQLSDLAARAARVLRDQGIRPGDVVAVLLPRSPELYIAALGIWKIGAIFCPLFGAFGPGPVKVRLEFSRAKALIADSALYARKVAAQRATLPDLTTVLLLSSDGSPAVAEDAGDFRTLLAQADPTGQTTEPTPPDHPAFLHFTSGTTGTPKGALHAHRSVLSYLVSGIAVFGLTENDIYWCTAEPGWITATAYAIVVPLAAGCTALLDGADFEPRHWYEVLRDEQVTVWYTTPTSIRLMMRYGAALARSYRRNTLRVAASVGEPLNPEAVAWGIKAFGLPFLDTWWQTEVGAIAVANLPGAQRPGSMGRPLPGCDIAVLHRHPTRNDPVTHPDEVGELALRATHPAMFIGYLGAPERSEAAFVDGWYRSGDLVRRDADGYLWFVGRGDDMIKSAGQSIGPFEIESTLMDHPAVAEIGVVGKPDLLLREVPVAYVSLNPGFEPGEALRLELLSFARQHLGAAMAPQEIHFIRALPKTTTGKILRRALKVQTHTETEEVDGGLERAGPEPFDDI